MKLGFKFTVNALVADINGEAAARVAAEIGGAGNLRRGGIGSEQYGGKKACQNARHGTFPFCFPDGKLPQSRSGTNAKNGFSFPARRWRQPVRQRFDARCRERVRPPP